MADFLDVIMHDGSLEFRLEQVEVSAANPPPAATMAGGETLIVIDDAGQVAALQALAAKARETGAPPGQT